MRDGSITANLRADAKAHMRHSSDFSAERPGALRMLSTLLTPPLLCSALHRLAYGLWTRGWRAPARVLARVNLSLHKAWIAPDARIGAGLYIPHTVGIVFEGHAGRDLVLFANCLVARGSDSRDRPILGDNVTVGAFAIVSGDVRIGTGARIAPGCVVHVDVPAGGMAVSIQRRRAG